ncbi:MAG: hypothetical protein SFU86_06315 [Pirellulaceae bacterium]|nr:hypothetical protein [Pirellulaceae bacterium]
MSLTKHFAQTLLLVATALFAYGCTSSTSNKPPEGEHDHGHEHGHDHGHDHDHSHAAAPHGGHVLVVGKEDYHLEWTHTDDGKVTVYVLDAAMKDTVPIPAEKLVIATKVGDKESSFELLAVDRTPDMPLSAKFEIVDKQLLGVLESLSEKVTAKVDVTINGKPFTVEFTPAGAEHKH